MKKLILMFIISLATNLYAGVNCEGRTAHHGGRRLFLSINSWQKPVLTIYLVKGHRGGGTFQLMDTERVEIQKLASGEVLVIDRDGATLVKIEDEVNEYGRRFGVIDFGQFKEPLQCSVQA